MFYQTEIAGYCAAKLEEIQQALEQHVPKGTTVTWCVTRHSKPCVQVGTVINPVSYDNIIVENNKTKKIRHHTVFSFIVVDRSTAV